MVAQAAPFGSELESSSAIKVLDLVTNRYHVGIVRESTEKGFEVELSANARFHAGQRVRFVVAGGQVIVARQSMHRGFITQVSTEISDRMNVRLAMLPETAVA